MNVVLWLLFHQCRLVRQTDLQEIELEKNYLAPEDNIKFTIVLIFQIDVHKNS
jgi:hypothetical protein